MRKICGKYHVEGERVVKTHNGEEVPEDEPLFLLRARDRLALPLLQIYQQLCLDDDCTDFQMVLVGRVLNDFVSFKNAHPERMKQPGITRGK